MMKKLLVLFLSLSLCSVAFAWDEWNYESEYSDVQSYDFDLSVEADGGQVEVEWDEFEWDNFKWYKFVYSTTDSNPVYPEDTSQYFWDDAERDEADVWLDAGSYYVRLCAITHDNDRYCSEVKKLVVEKWEYKKYDKDYDDDKDEEYEKKQAIKKAILKKEAEKKVAQKPIKNIATNKAVEKRSNLSTNMKNRIDTALERFVERLEEKGYDDEKMVDTLKAVIGRLDKFKAQERYTLIVEYMVEVLEEYIEKYDDSFWDLEDILNDF